MIDVSISVPASDIAALEETFAKYVAHLGGNVPKATEKVCVKIITALRARTKASAKHRKVVANPNRYKGGKAATNRYGRAHAHIAAWYEAHGSAARKTGKTRAWLPRLRDLVDRKYAARYAIKKMTQRKGNKYLPIGGFDPLDNIKKSDAVNMAKLRMARQYNIYDFGKGGRRGLARASWSWMLRKLGKPDGQSGAEMGGISTVNKNHDSLSSVIYLRNVLSYIRRSMTKGDVTTVMSSARKMLIDEMEGHAKGAARAAGVSAA